SVSPGNQNNQRPRKGELMPKYRRGRGGIYRRKDSRVWWIAYYFDKKQLCESSGERDRAKAIELLGTRTRQGREARGQVERGPRPGGKSWIWLIAYRVKGGLVWESTAAANLGEALELQARAEEAARTRPARTNAVTFDDLFALLLSDMRANGR